MSAQKKAGTPGPLCAHLPPSLKVEAGPGDPRFRVGAEQAGGNGSIPQTAAPSAVERRLRGPCCRGAVCPGGVGWSSQHGPTCELRVCPRVRVTVSACRQDVCCSYTARTRAVCARQCVCAHVCARTCAQVWAWRAGPLRALLPDACRRGPAVARELVPGVTTVSGVPVSGDQAGSSAEVTGCSGAGIGQAPQRSYPHTRCTHACLTHSHSYQSTRAYTPILTYTHSPVHAHTRAYPYVHPRTPPTCSHVHTHSHTCTRSFTRSRAHTHRLQRLTGPFMGGPRALGGQRGHRSESPPPRPAPATHQAPPDPKSHQLGARLPSRRLGR